MLSEISVTQKLHFYMRIQFHLHEIPRTAKFIKQKQASCLSRSGEGEKVRVIVLLFFEFLLEYSCFTMLCWLLLDSKVNQMYIYLGFPGDSVVKTPPASMGDVSSVPGLGRSPGGGHGNPLQCSCLRIPWTEEPGGLQFMGSQRS